MQGHTTAANACFEQAGAYRRKEAMVERLPQYQATFKELNDWFLSEHHHLTAQALHYQMRKEAIKQSLLHSTAGLQALVTSPHSYVFINDVLHSIRDATLIFSNLHRDLAVELKELDKKIQDVDTRLQFTSVWQTMFLQSQTIFKQPNRHVHLELQPSLQINKPLR